jgi:mRNA-degrading endonuclease toxin of MazEF toxin-antitoxin module
MKKNPKQGEIWEVSFGDAGHAEPGVIVSTSALRHLPFRIVVPLKRWLASQLEYAWIVALPSPGAQNSAETCIADAKQCISLSIDRLKRRIGKVKDEDLQMIREAIALCLGLRVA